MTINQYIAEKLPTMEGWCTPEKALALAEVVQRESPSLIVEIGVFGGRSLIAMALATSPENTTVIGIDPWRPEESTAGFENDAANRDWWKQVDHELIYQKAAQAVVDCGVMDRTFLFRGTSADQLPLIANLSKIKGGIGMLHVDGNHSQESSCFDVSTYVPLVRKGSIVCFDDTNWSTTSEAQKILLETCNLEATVEAGGQACGFFRKL